LKLLNIKADVDFRDLRYLEIRKGGRGSQRISGAEARIDSRRLNGTTEVVPFPILAGESASERLTIFLIPVAKWSDGTADAATDH
jgi:hypothetical protein